MYCKYRVWYMNIHATCRTIICDCRIMSTKHIVYIHPQKRRFILAGQIWDAKGPGLQEDLRIFFWSKVLFACDTRSVSWRLMCIPLKNSQQNQKKANLFAKIGMDDLRLMLCPCWGTHDLMSSRQVRRQVRALQGQVQALLAVPLRRLMKLTWKILWPWNPAGSQLLTQGFMADSGVAICGQVRGLDTRCYGHQNTV